MQSEAAKEAGRKNQVGLENAAKKWTTPQAHDSSGGNPERVGRFGTKHGGANLADDVTLWQTPNSGGFETRRQVGKTDRETLLGGQAKAWSTPRASDGEKGGPNQSWTAGGAPLPAQTAHWATPTSRDWKDGANPSSAVATNSLLGRQAPRTMQAGEVFRLDTGPLRLNPAFVEWLMGWPAGWTTISRGLTSSTSSETVSSLSKPPAHLDSSGKPSDAA